MTFGNAGRASDADGDDSRRIRRMFHGAPGYGETYFFGQLQRGFSICIAQNDSEFFAPEASHRVSRSVNDLKDGCGNLAQALIPTQMSVKIVVELKVIHIEQQQRQI